MRAWSDPRGYHNTYLEDSKEKLGQYRWASRPELHLITRFDNVVSCPVNCHWPSPGQSFLVLDDLLHVRSKTIYVFGNGGSSLTRGVRCRK
jgi:hypothetical protein